MISTEARPAMSKDELISYDLREAAELLGVSEGTMRRKVKGGEIPYFRVGRQIRIRHVHLLEWIEQQEQQGEAP